MISVCQNSMLNTVSTASWRQCSRPTQKGTRRHTNTNASTGSPSHIDRLRNVSGGKPVTPIFMIGQLKPQTSVISTSRISCFRVTAYMGGRRFDARLCIAVITLKWVCSHAH